MFLAKKRFLILKIVIALLAYAFVAYRVYDQGFPKFKLATQLEGVNLMLLFLVIVLMFINWLLEAVKWKRSLRGIQSISLKQALNTALYGASVGLLTPNRIGDPIGRVALLDSKNKPQAAIAAVQCALAQQLATIAFGILGLCVLIDYGFLEQYFRNPFVIISLVVSLVIVFIFLFKTGLVLRILSKLSFLKKAKIKEALNIDNSKSKIAAIILLSFLRYAIFTTQLVLMLFALGFNSDVAIAYASVCATYLFASLVPVLSIADAGVRSGFALVIIGAFWNNPVGITLAAHAIWILNVAVPALIAAWFPFAKMSQLRND